MTDGVHCEIRDSIRALYGKIEPAVKLNKSREEIADYISENYTFIRLDEAGSPETIDGVNSVFLSAAHRGSKAVGRATLGLGEDYPRGKSLRSCAIIDAVRCGAIKMLCPFSGNVVEANATLGSEWIYHRFENDYCLASKFGAVMTCVDLETIWVFPDRELILYVGNGCNLDSNRRHIGEFFSRSFSRAAEIAAYLKQSLAGTPRTITVADFWCPHMSHNLWNLQTGWANVLADTIPGSLTRILTYENQNFFGSVTELFGDRISPQTRIDSVKSEDDILDAILNGQLSVVTVKDEFFTKDFADRVLARAYGVCSPSFLEDVKKFREKCDIVVLTTIRLDNRAWIEQKEGLAQLFTKLKEEFPGIGLVIDGLSSDTVKGWTTGWMSVEADLDVARSIKDGLPVDMDVMFAVGRAFAESIVLMDTSDLFIAPSGSGMAIYKWICNKPGLAFSNTAVLDEKSPHKWPLRVWHDCTFRSGMKPTRHLPVALVRDGEIARDHVSRANFHLDWMDLYKESRQLIEDFRASKFSDGPT